MSSRLSIDSNVKKCPSLIGMTTLVNFRGPTTYIHDSYHNTTTLTIDNDASPLRYKCTCISEADPNISMIVLFQKPFC